jgi:glycosyltransferase involved in cell wall biosynthesis
VVDEVVESSAAKGKLVSVIIPFYNRLELLPRALKSVIDQTYGELEIIVVDDASSVSPEEVLVHFSDPRVVYIRHEKNQGVSAARNTGIKAARGDYIAFLDSDDEWLLTKTEKQLSQLRSNESEHKVAYCLSEVVSDESDTIIEVNSFQGGGNILHQVLIGSGGSQGWTGLVILVNEIMIAKSDLMDVGVFDERYRMHEDWEFMIRLAEKFQFVCVKEVLVRNHKHRLGHIGDQFQRIPEIRHLMFDAHRDLYIADKRASAAFFSELAYYEGINGTKGRALLSLMRSVAFQPFRRDPYAKIMLLLTNRFRKPRTEW